jgi:signal transduction histidine kinase
MMGNLLGYGQTQVSPSLEAWRVRLHPEDRERVLAEVERVKREGGPYRIDYRISRADTSEVRWLSSRAKCTIDDQGKVIRFSGVTFDATELRSAQDLLRGALEEANAFARNVSHELRAPLRAITMTAQLLLDEYAWRPVDLEGQAQFGRLIDAARRLDAMTEDLLAYSRMAQEQMALGPVDLETILGKVLADMKDDLAQRRAEVRLEGPFPRIQGHACTLYHALTNLLYNAIKFVAPDTTPCVNIRPERREGWVRLWVEDNGIGISPPDQVRLFQVFERLSPEYPGTGIGLALVRKGIERMGGKTGVESEPGKGSRFWIELPSSADSPAGPPS